MTNPLIEEARLLSGRLSQIATRREQEVKTLAELKAKMDEYAAQKAELLKAVALIDKTIGVVSANGIGKIESTVTNGLQLVFSNPDYCLRVIKKETARGNNYYLEVYKGAVAGPVLSTFGGGVSNVIAFLLRVIMIKRFKLGKLLVVDENFNNVSPKYLPKVSELLKTLADDGGYTIFAISHQEALSDAADHFYTVYPGPELR